MRPAATERIAVRGLALVAALTLLPNEAAQAVAQTDSARQGSLTTRMVTVDGVPLRVRSTTLTERGRGQPVVIFESGGSLPLETWDPILPSIARLAPVIAYDRSGTGRSPWDSLPPTPARVVARLRRLLVTLDVAPPYVLVGHSWGGALVRYFGGTVPSDVAGAVYIDPTDITQSPADERAVFEAIGAGAAARDSFYARMERAMTGVPAQIRAEAEVTMGIFRREVRDREIPDAPAVPATVIVAGRPPVLPAAGLPFDPKRYADAMQQQRLRSLRNWVRAPGQLLVATNAGHMVHRDDPALVIEAIRHLVQRR